MNLCLFKCIPVIWAVSFQDAAQLRFRERSGCPLTVKARNFEPSCGAEDADTRRRAHEEFRLLNRCERNDEPTSAVKLDIRIRRAPCVSFFPSHDLPFPMELEPAVAYFLPDIHDSEANGQG